MRLAEPSFRRGGELPEESGCDAFLECGVECVFDARGRQSSGFLVTREYGHLLRRWAILTLMLQSLRQRCYMTS